MQRHGAGQRRADGMPSVRMVLLKGADGDGFVFYTNFESRKGRELLAHPQAALCFHWKSLRRQVRVEGAIELVTEAEADAYFATRARGSQIGVWASEQSRPMAGKAELLKRVGGLYRPVCRRKVARPPHWSGFRLVPRGFEFLEGRAVPPARPPCLSPRRRGLGHEVLYP